MDFVLLTLAASAPCAHAMPPQRPWRGARMLLAEARAGLLRYGCRAAPAHTTARPTARISLSALSRCSMGLRPWPAGSAALFPLHAMSPGGVGMDQPRMGCWLGNPSRTPMHGISMLLHVPPPPPACDSPITRSEPAPSILSGPPRRGRPAARAHALRARARASRPRGRVRTTVGALSDGRGCDPGAQPRRRRVWQSSRRSNDGGMRAREHPPGLTRGIQSQSAPPAAATAVAATALAAAVSFPLRAGTPPAASLPRCPILAARTTWSTGLWRSSGSSCCSGPIALVSSPGVCRSALHGGRVRPRLNHAADAPPTPPSAAERGDAERRRARRRLWRRPQRRRPHLLQPHFAGQACCSS
eukprot:364051-Chlamydomonas_euryale.AAC.10